MLGCFMMQGVTDATLMAIAASSALEELSIDRAYAVTDAGMAALSKLTRLTAVQLHETRGLTDAGLSQLAALTGLEVRGCTPGAAAWQHLVWLPADHNGSWCVTLTVHCFALLSARANSRAPAHNLDDYRRRQLVSATAEPPAPRCWCCTTSRA
jgi:hypothetical protein